MPWMKRLANFDHQRDKSLERLTAPQTELAALDKGPLVPADGGLKPASTPFSAGEKVALFRQLFRGREDVFPVLWTSSKTGLRGFSPACGNEWVSGLCEKSNVKCSECPNQAYLPITDRVVLDHLQGRHTMGIYPLLKNETCWFLAADFDKASWILQKAAHALVNGIDSSNNQLC